MLTLAWGTGSRSFGFGERTYSDDDENRLFFNVRELLIAQGQSDVAEMLALGFHIHSGLNDFGDEFEVLHAELPLSDYVAVKQRAEGSEAGAFRARLDRLRESVGELGPYIRFVSCSLLQQSPPAHTDEAPGDPQTYFVERPALGRGGFACVYKATHRGTGDVVALKKALVNDDESVARLRREIEEQRDLLHPHVMPILDHDEDCRWFTMPLAEGSLEKLRDRLNEEDLVVVFEHVALGLQAAHDKGLVHRDVTPGNILAFPEASGGWRWVIADFGLVRRPRGQTTNLRTASQRLLGTEGFAAPELWDDAHNAGPEADVYGLGRVVAWAITGERPKPNAPLEPSGPWRHFVRATTRHERARRVQSMAELRRLLGDIGSQSGPEGALTERAQPLLERVNGGDPTALSELVTLALDHPLNADLYLDQVAEMSVDVLVALVRDSPASVQTVLDAMARNLDEFGDRPYDYANTILRWFESVARAAAYHNDHGLLEDAAAVLFDTEPKCHRFAQRHRTRAWLDSLDGSVAETVARALRRHDAAAAWYLDERWHPSRTMAGVVRDALHEGKRASEERARATARHDDDEP